MQVAEAVTSLLECVQAGLTTPVCKAFWHPGPNAPFDVCESSDSGNGQLWVAHGTDQPGWPAPSAEPVTCATTWSAAIEVGIVRCAQGQLGDDGSLPAADLITADAQQQDEDRLVIRNAIMCCWDVDGKDVIVEGWEAIEPQGGCVGGVWTVVIRDAGCDCASWDQPS